MAEAKPKPKSKYPRITDARLMEVAKKRGGVVLAVADYFGKSRSDIYYHINAKPHIKAAFEEADAIITDLAESKHMQAIQDGYYPAVWNHLSTKGRDRGYVKQSEMVLSGEVKGFILELETVEDSIDHTDDQAAPDQEANGGMEPAA